MTHLRLTTFIAAPPETCFDLVLNVDVQRVLGNGMEAVAGTTSGTLRRGDLVTWRARHFGLVWRMTSKIVEVERPDCFYDEMQDGPFAFWRHRHEFLRAPDGTRMIDDVHFGAPLGPVGWITERVVLDAYMRRLLTQRNKDLKTRVERQSAA